MLAIAAIAVMSMSACSSCHRDKKVKSCDFEACWNADYSYMSDIYGEPNIYFFWAQARYDKNFTDENFRDSAAITEVKTLFQLYYVDGKLVPRDEEDSQNDFDGDAVCLQFTHDADGNVEIDTLYGHWLECVAMVKDSLSMTLAEATECLFESNDPNVVIPESNIVVMRTPIYPPFPTKPYFFFGTTRGYVMVNSADGKIVFDK